MARRGPRTPRGVPTVVLSLLLACGGRTLEPPTPTASDGATAASAESDPAGHGGAAESPREDGGDIAGMSSSAGGGGAPATPASGGSGPAVIVAPQGCATLSATIDPRGCAAEFACPDGTTTVACGPGATTCECQTPLGASEYLLGAAPTEPCGLVAAGCREPTVEAELPLTWVQTQLSSEETQCAEQGLLTRPVSLGDEVPAAVVVGRGVVTCAQQAGVWSCRCEDDRRALTFVAPLPVPPAQACQEAWRTCFDAELVRVEAPTCVETGAAAALTGCETELFCSSRATAASVPVELYEPLDVVCSPRDDTVWDCQCVLGLDRIELEAFEPSPWSVCPSVAASCIAAFPD